MNKYVSRGLWVALAVGGFSLVGIGTANAAETSGGDGLLTGNELVSSVTAPVTVSGNSVTLIGDSTDADPTTGDGSSEPAVSALAPSLDAATTSSDGIASGDEAIVSVTAPIQVSGNTVTVIGDSPSAAADADADADGVLSGDQAAVVADVPVADVPVDLSGNTVTVIGDLPSASTDLAGSEAEGSDAILLPRLTLFEPASSDAVESAAIPMQRFALLAGIGSEGVVGDGQAALVADAGSTMSGDTASTFATPLVATASLAALAPTTPAGSSDSQAPAGVAGEVVATSYVPANGVHSLASTGSGAAGLSGLVAVLLAVGAGLLAVASRKVLRS